MCHRICYFLPGPTDPAYRKRRVVRYLASFRGGCYGNTTIDWETPYATLYVPVVRHLPIEWLLPPVGVDHDVYRLAFDGIDEHGIHRLVYQYDASHRLPIPTRWERLRQSLST
jgi:hypothetical protein